MQITTATRTVEIYANTAAYVTYRNVKDGAAYGPMRTAKADAKAGTVGREVFDAAQAPAEVEVATEVAEAEVATEVATEVTEAEVTEAEVATKAEALVLELELRAAARSRRAAPGSYRELRALLRL